MKKLIALIALVGLIFAGVMHINVVKKASAKGIVVCDGVEPDSGPILPPPDPLG